MNPFPLLFSLFVAAASAVPLGAEVLMLDFGPTNIAGDALTNSPYHTVNSSFSGTIWNKVEKDDVRPGRLRMADGIVATKLGLDLGATREAGVTVINLNARPDGYHALGGAANTGVYEDASAGRDAIFSGAKFDRSRAVGMQVTGLPAGDYVVYVVARSTNMSQPHTQRVYVGIASASGDFDFASPSYIMRPLSYRHGIDATDSWVEDANYVRFAVTITAGQVLNLASIGDDRNERRGFLNCVQIVPAPTPLATSP